MISHRSATLNELLRALPPDTKVTGPIDVTITGIALDSRTVSAGDVFVAIAGAHVDGHGFVEDAVRAGALAIVVRHDWSGHEQRATVVRTPDTARALSRLSAAFYGDPSLALRVSGVTGTNGKTTTTHMIASILDAAGLRCGTMGTIGATFAGEQWSLENTTPPASQLQALLAQMRERGAQAVAMEVSSHALALQRVCDVRFEVGALTNVTRDHLDFHGTFEAYAAAKHLLFELAQRCVFNADDPLGAAWANEFAAHKPTLTYALHDHADIRPGDVSIRTDGSAFTLDRQAFEVRIPGRFNVENALCAIAVAREMGVSDADAARGLMQVTRVPGRMEHVRADERGIDVFVDYAHTPDALENVLKTLREAARCRLLLVFGCGGDRDRGKRALMGEVAARCSDYAYLTSDNPRTEAPRAIISEIEAGMREVAHTVIEDRRAAIHAAVAGARPGDVILIAGKGHERYQIIGERVLPFDDVQVAREAIARAEAPA